MEKKEWQDMPELSDVASATECTGPFPAAPRTEEEEEALRALSSNALPKGGKKRKK